MQAFHERASSRLSQAHGYVAQRTHHGLVAYWGYPSHRASPRPALASHLQYASFLVPNRVRVSLAVI